VVVPIATICPRSITAMRRVAHRRRCAIINTVRPVISRSSARWTIRSSPRRARRRLVEQQNGPAEDRARDRDALPLAARTQARSPSNVVAIGHALDNRSRTPRQAAYFGIGCTGRP
jgi:hypothetical protein